MKHLSTFLLIVAFGILVGCTTENPDTEVKKYDIVTVQGVNLESKNWFGYTITKIENDSYDVTYLENGKEKTINLDLGEYGLNKLRTSDFNHLSFEHKGIDSYITLHLTEESQKKWDVSY